MSAATDLHGLVPLHSVGRADVAAVGSKAAALGELARAGFPVPEGLVLPAGALADDRLPAALDAALDALGGGPLAVRSSAVAEDLADASFAGQYETVLGVEDAPALREAVHRVMASAAGARVDAYRRDRGVAAPSTTGVLLQRQVAAESAGIALTADPLTGARDEVLVSAVRGLGDALADGRADAEEWVLRDGAATCRRPGGVLSERQARAVAALACRVQAHVGAPQDVEWAFAGGRLHLLQARPMTALAEPVRWEAPAPGGWARNFRLGEWLPDPVTPLFESWLLTRLEQVLFERYREMGGTAPPEPAHVVVHGWYFGTMNWLPETPGQLLRTLGGWLPKLATRPREAVMMFPGLARFGVDRALGTWRADLLPAYRTAVAAAEARVDEAGPGELVTLVEELATRAGDQFTSLTLVAGFGWKSEVALARFHDRHVADRVGFGHQRLLCGLDTPPPRHPALVTLDWVQPPVPRPAHDPDRRAAVAAERRAAEEAVREVLAGRPRLARRYADLLGTAQRFARIREEQLDVFTAAWPVMRAAVLRLGDHLAGQGRLPRAEDVFFLTREELDGLLAAAPVPPDTAGRRAVWEGRRRLVPPLALGEFGTMSGARMRETMAGIQPAWRATRPVDGGTVGIPASPGRATGPVRLVHGPADFDRVQAGDVLVTRAATAAYLPLFARAAAVVTDVGSVTAHSSLVVREYGIPCVVACGDATTTLEDGRVVTVDGTLGLVVPAGEGSDPR